MDLLELATYLNDAGNYFVVVPIAFGIYFSGKNRPVQSGLVVGLSLILMQLLFFLLTGIQSAFVFFYVSTFLELLVFLALFLTARRGRRDSRAVLAVGVVLLLFFPVDALLITGLRDFGISAFLARVYLLAVSIAILTRLFRTNLDANIFANPVVWLCFGLVLNNYVGSFNVFSLKIMSYSQVLVLQFYMIWALVRVLMYTAFSYSFYLSDKIHE